MDIFEDSFQQPPFCLGSELVSVVESPTGELFLADSDWTLPADWKMVRPNLLSYSQAHRVAARIIRVRDRLDEQQLGMEEESESFNE